MRLKQGIILAILALFVFGTVDLASAQIQQIGPTDDITGFPTWYRDSRQGKISSKLAPCLNAVNCVFDPPIVGNPVSQRSGFGKRMWYWHATATIMNGPVVIGKLEAGLGATYAGAVAAANRVTDSFVKITLTNLPVNGRYTVVHPFGQQTFNVTLNPVTGKRSVTFINKVGGKNFTLAMNGPIDRFPVATAPAPRLGFIGNPKVLQTIHFLTPPNTQNFFKITGPPAADLGGPVVTPNVVTQRRFRLMGQIF